MQRYTTVKVRLTKIEEELTQHIQRKQGPFAQVREVKPDDREEDGQDEESSDLNGLAAEKIDSCDCTPVAWNGSGADQDEVANSRIIEQPVHIFLPSIANCV